MRLLIFLEISSYIYERLYIKYKLENFFEWFAQWWKPIYETNGSDCEVQTWKILVDFLGERGDNW